jgi:hypothetical protein
MIHLLKSTATYCMLSGVQSSPAQTKVVDIFHQNISQICSESSRIPGFNNLVKASPDRLGKLELENLLKLSPQAREYAVEYADNFLALFAKNGLPELLHLSPDGQEYGILYPEGFLHLKNVQATDMIDTFLFENMEDSLTTLLNKLSQSETISSSSIFHAIMNTPNQNGITLLHKDARNGNLERIDRFIHETLASNAVLNEAVYFSSKTLEDCKASSQISLLDTIPIDAFAFPLIVAQNYCNAMVKMKNNEILTLQHTNAKSVHDSLIFRKTGKTGYNNTLSLFLNHKHGFSFLQCSSCAEGASFNNPIGFLFRFGDDFISLKHSEKNQMLKITFFITDQQAESAWREQDFLRNYNSITDFKPISINCIDFTSQIFHAALGTDPFPFFTRDQLSLNFSNPNPAIQYARFKYKNKIPTDFLFSLIYLSFLILKNSKSKKNAKNEEYVQPQKKMPIYMKTALADLASHGIRYAVQMITGTDSFLLSTATNFSIFSNLLLFKELFSAERIDLTKPPSLWNRKRSFYVLSGLTRTTLVLFVKITGIFNRNVDEISIIQFYYFTAFTLLRLTEKMLPFQK